VARDPEGTREAFADVFRPGDLLFSPVEWPNPGRKPRSLWLIEGSARFNLGSDPTGSLLNVELTFPVDILAVAATPGVRRAHVATRVRDSWRFKVSSLKGFPASRSYDRSRLRA
jgi:hypothetical protein